MRESFPLLLAVGPTVGLVQRALAENGIGTDGGELIRMVKRHVALRGWSRVMPVVAADVDRWGDLAGYDGAMLRETLLTMIAKGQMRLAQDADLARFRAASSGSDEVRRNDEIVSTREDLSAMPREGGRVG